jgi:nucleosome assembly protein 1-like 1
MDFELGEQLKDELIPRAVDWYTGDAADDSDYGESDEDDEDSDDDDNDDDDDDDR